MKGAGIKGVDFVEFEETKHKNELDKFKEIYDVKVQGGYPTLFRIENGKISYHTGDRDTKSLIHWASGKSAKKITGGAKKTRKTRKNRKNRKTRRR
jgi:hypothetical protein